MIKRSLNNSTLVDIIFYSQLNCLCISSSEFDERENLVGGEIENKGLFLIFAIVLVIIALLFTYFKFFSSKKQETPSTPSSSIDADIPMSTDSSSIFLVKVEVFSVTYVTSVTNLDTM